MKRIFTLLVAVAALCSVATARNLWTGSYAPNVSPKAECPKIDAKEFAGLDLASKPELQFTLTASTEDVWRALELWSDGGGCVYNYGKLAPGAQTVKIAITEEFLAKLQQYGFFPGGANYTVTSIDLGTVTPYDGLVWEGVGEIKDWASSFTIPAANLAKIKEGYTLCVDAAPINENEWHALWVSMANGNGNISPEEEHDLATRKTLKYVLTPEQVEKLKLNGLYFTGYNAKITKVYVTGNDISTAVTPIMDEAVDKGVYSLSGVKVASSMENANELAPGVYVCGGKKFVVR